VAGLQQVVEVGVVEGPVAELVDDRIARLGIDLVDDVRAVELLADVGVVAQNALPAAADRRGQDRRPLPHQRPLRSGHELRVDDGMPRARQAASRA
jgi:hypothetical protein